MGARKFYSDDDIRDMMSRFGTKDRPVYIKSLDEDHTLEANMKNSLNRIGEDYEQPQSETPTPEDDGSKRTDD